MIDVASWEFNIPVDFVDDGGNVHDAIITNLYDSDGEQTWRPEAAMVAVGVMISGPRAGEWIVIDDITSDELKPYVH